jgi:hypothetical protein
MMACTGLALTADQAHMLFAKHARRHGVEWMSPGLETPLALRTSAEAMLNDFLLC